MRKPTFTAMRRCSLFFFFLLVALFGTAQKGSIPQLKQQLKKTSIAKKKGEIAAMIAKEYFDVHADSSIHYATLAIQFGKKAQDTSVIAKGYHGKGVALQKKAQWDNALASFYAALRLREGLQEKTLAASTSLSIGNSYLALGKLREDEEDYENADRNFLKAQKNVEKSIETFLKNKDSINVAIAYQSLGSCSFCLYDYRSAIRFFSLSYDWTPKNDKEQYYGESEMNLLIAEYEMAAEKGDLSGSKELLTRYTELSNYFKKYTQNKQLVNLNINIAGILWNDEFEQSKQLLQSADTLAQQSNLTDFRITANQYLYELYKEMGNADSALFYFEKVTDLKREISDSKTRTKIEELNIQYNTEKKERMLLEQRTEIAQSKAERDIFTSSLIGAGILFIGLIAFFFQRQYIQRLRRKREHEAHNQEISSLLVNQELKSIEAMLEGQETERKRIAEDLHDRLGSTLSAAKMYFEATTTATSSKNDPKHAKAYQLLDKAIKDTREISHNLVSGALSKFGLFVALRDLKETIEGASNVTVNIDINAKNERFSSEVEIQVYRIIQEVFSNSLKHAKPSQLSAKLVQEGNTIHLTISDNGKGFNTAAESKGMGLKNIQGRIAKLGGSFQLATEKGTHYSITFNLTQID